MYTCKKIDRLKKIEDSKKNNKQQFQHNNNNHLAKQNK